MIAIIGYLLCVTINCAICAFTVRWGFLRFETRTMMLCDGFVSYFYLKNLRVIISTNLAFNRITDIVFTNIKIMKSIKLLGIDIKNDHLSINIIR